MTTPYRPSNGCEGMDFQNQWCCECVKYGPPPERPSCDILAASFSYLIGDENYPKEWVYGQDGRPSCTAFEKNPEKADGGSD